MSTEETSTDNIAEIPAIMSLPSNVIPLMVRACEPRSRTYPFLGAGLSGCCLIGADETGGVFSVFEIAAETGAGIAPHVHTLEEETLYILDGNFEIQRGDHIIEMAAGMALHGPRGVVHSFRCVGEQPGRALIITTPGGIENYFAELNDDEKARMDFCETSFEHRETLLSKYGMRSGPEPENPDEYGHLAPSRFVGLGNHRGHFLASGDDTQGALILSNLEVDPQGGPQPHLHRREDEAFYILEGTFRIRLGDEITEAGPGDFVFAPRGAVHCWSNVGEAPAYALVLIAPADNYQDFTLAMEKLVGQIAEDTPPDAIDPALRGEIVRLHQRHAIELVESAAIIK